MRATKVEQTALRAEGAAAERAAVVAYLATRAERLALGGNRGEGRQLLAHRLAVTAEFIGLGLHVLPPAGDAA